MSMLATGLWPQIVTRAGRALGRDRIAAWMFIGPSCAVLLIVFVFPMLQTLRLSFLPEGSREGGWTFSNYTTLLSDPVFRQVGVNTLGFVLASVIGYVVLGLGLALLLNAPLPGRTVFRMLAILPWTIPDVIVGIIWRWLLNPLYGPVNALLSAAGLGTSQWLADPTLAMPSVVIANLWRGTSFAMLILLAGLQAIPSDFYEAAAIDGAGRVQQLWYIVLPCLRAPLIVAVALSGIWEFRRFALVMSMTGGGPGMQTEILSISIYRQYFDYYRFETASAAAVLLALFTLIVSIPQIRVMARQGEE